jgi:hypothetical protein
LRGFAESVVSLVPAGFSEYLRIFHPAYRTGGLHRAVTWAEIARANGTYMHAGVQLGSITGSERYEREGQPGVFDQPPETGNLPRELLDSLPHVLARRTSTPGRCYFAVWEGWGGCCPRSVLRRCSRFQRTITYSPGPLTPSVNWRTRGNRRGRRTCGGQDHAWCVATEIDLKTTYIGGLTIHARRT